jgi:putative chitinase
MDILTINQWREALQKIIDEINSEVEKQEAVIETPSIDLSVFFNEIKPHLFVRLSVPQVEGMEAKLKAFSEANWPVSWAAYALATSYHETAKRMVPVREGLSASDAWRKKNLRYYPWYGRGDVQLTWEDNYKKADRELGLNGALVNNLDLALDKDISAKILVKGMEEGWFSGDKEGRHTLRRHLPDEKGTKTQFKPARRIINLMDKADLIANYALGFQEALIKAGYTRKED